MYGKCGLLIAYLTDPLSKIISCLNSYTEFNSIGIYYTLDNKCNVLLFNLYDNNTVSWLRLGYTMENFLNSPFVNRIDFYPIKDEKVEGHFTSLSMSVLNENSKKLIPKHNSYHNILNNKPNEYNAFDVINKILCSLDNSLTFVNTHLLHSKYISTKIKYSTSDNEIIDNIEYAYIIQECRKEIITLSAVAIENFIYNEQFRTTILYKMKSDEDLHALMGIITTIFNNIDDRSMINTEIKNINRIYRSNISRIDERNKLIDLPRLSFYIDNIVKNIDSPLFINISDLLNIYNDIAEKNNYPPLYYTTTQEICRNLPVLVPKISSEKFSDSSLLTHFDVYKSNNQQLMDVLTYISSLENDKFIGLQNEITAELAHRLNLENN